jgi:molybdopterin biosynthesis enzyme MoaB
MLSRGIAGIRIEALIINLPKIPRAVKEGIEVLIPARTLAKIKGDISECGTQKGTAHPIYFDF